MEELCAVLPQDVMLNEILVRLPVESIGRFRCVSKPWRRLLSSPQFVKAHLHRHHHGPESIVCSLYHPSIATLSRGGGDVDCVLRRVNFPMGKILRRSSQCFSVDMDRWRVEAACHGLLLLSSTKDNKNSMILVNPITSESTEIPDLCLDRRAVYGLGYDSFGDDYKIVSVLLCDMYDYKRHYFIRETYKDHDRVDIYSVKSKTWRRLADSPYHGFPRGSAYGVFLNGCIHWWAEKSGSFVIAAFDLAREEFEELPLPVRIDTFRELTVLDGRLAMWVNDEIGYANLWVMKEYGVKDSWFIIKPGIRIIPEFPDDAVCMERNEHLIGFLGDEVILYRYRGRFIHQDGYHGLQFVAYNWRNGVKRNLVVTGFPNFFERVTPLIPSLVSPRYL